VVYLYQYCFKYLILKHGCLKQAFLFSTIHNLVFVFIIWLFILLIQTPNAKINKSYSFDKRLRKLVQNYVKNNYNEDNKYEIELSHKENEMVEAFVKKRNLNLATRNMHGQLAICLVCKLIKPDRSFHCNKCNKCILKRDHHCPWLNKCIGYSNHKYYCLLLTYLLVYLVFIQATLVYSLWKYSDRIIEPSTNHANSYTLNFYLFKLFVVVVALSTLPVLLLFLNAYYLAALNLSNIEQIFPTRVKYSTYYLIQSDNIFNLGSIWQNLEQIFGPNIILGMFPVWTSLGNGHEFPIRFSSSIV
jgi:hypothetical protein